MVIPDDEEGKEEDDEPKPNILRVSLSETVARKDRLVTFRYLTEFAMRSPLER